MAKGIKKTRKLPMRTCLGCREKFDKRTLLRIVKPKDEEISIDITGKKQGRGSYICKKEECLNKAIKTKQIERALEDKLPEDFLEKSLRIIKDE